MASDFFQLASTVSVVVRNGCQRVELEEIIVQILQPSGWPRPKGYSNGLVASGKMVFLAGLVGWNEEEKIETDDFAGQTRQVFQNIVSVLKEAGAGPEHIRALAAALGKPVRS